MKIKQNYNLKAIKLNQKENQKLKTNSINPLL